MTQTEIRDEGSRHGAVDEYESSRGWERLYGGSGFGSGDPGSLPVEPFNEMSGEKTLRVWDDTDYEVVWEPGYGGSGPADPPGFDTTYPPETYDAQVAYDGYYGNSFVDWTSTEHQKPIERDENSAYSQPLVETPPPPESGEPGGETPVDVNLDYLQDYSEFLQTIFPGAKPVEGKDFADGPWKVHALQKGPAAQQSEEMTFEEQVMAALQILNEDVYNFYQQTGDDFSHMLVFHKISAWLRIGDPYLVYRDTVKNVGTTHDLYYYEGMSPIEVAQSIVDLTLNSSYSNTLTEDFYAFVNLKDLDAYGAWLKEHQRMSVAQGAEFAAMMAEAYYSGLVSFNEAGDLVLTVTDIVENGPQVSHAIALLPFVSIAQAKTILKLAGGNGAELLYEMSPQVAKMLGEVRPQHAKMALEEIAQALQNKPNMNVEAALVGRLMQIKKFEDILLRATRNPNSTEVVLGKSKLVPSYIDVGQGRNATYFLDDWDKLSQEYSADELWEINKLFLDEQLRQGKTFIFSQHPSFATGTFAAEVQYIIDYYKTRGREIEFVQDGPIWRIKVK